MSISTLSINKVSVISVDDRACRQIQKTTERMGICCHISDHIDNTQTDLLLIDVQHYFADIAVQKLIRRSMPIVGLLAHGSPTEIERAISMGALSVVGKPIHQVSLYSAFHMALKLSQQNVTLHQELETLRTRHKLRPVVIEAVIKVMETHKLTEQKAYELLRQYSMHRNLPIEQICLELAQGNMSYSGLRGEG
ncbi:ANTAR domain-containing protein [Vibrio sp. S9_S30]|uniref:ANTAR domain-containing response regulator n=1 Tax=Vibrio sp. S9_S30 TaxID=2720226 RepID=UPI0016817FDD|nr:ANTAR domain-containing protein [Vibrio sp. S9_S30]MBD1556281.1 ANTAR domain-containing protein [Vibrio sp. S9_S30]